jgi:hypothetical protein
MQDKKQNNVGDGVPESNQQHKGERYESTPVSILLRRRGRLLVRATAGR